MNNIEKLKKSIEKRLPISFEYNKPGKILGKRIGNVHALFIFTSKSNEISTKIDIYQTGGVSDSSFKKPLPAFRKFNIEFIENIEFLETENKFEIHGDYNPEYYDQPIAKI